MHDPIRVDPRPTAAAFGERAHGNNFGALFVACAGASDAASSMSAILFRMSSIILTLEHSR